MEDFDFDISNIPPSGGDDKPIPFDDTNNPKISHSPLSLGEGSKIGVPKVEATISSVKPVEMKESKQITSSERITGVKTFFTKLHPGAINFLDEQMCDWLSKNPGISIKRTNIITGPVAAKKTEPNIIISVWY